MEIGQSSEVNNLDLVLDIRVKVTVQLGSCELPMKEILALAPGSIIQLKQDVKDPLPIIVNGKHIAYGEVVVLEEAFGIKVTEVISENK